MLAFKEPLPVLTIVFGVALLTVENHRNRRNAGGSFNAVQQPACMPYPVPGGEYETWA